MNIFMPHYSAIRRFNRFELKYIIPLQTAEKLKKEVLQYTIPDNYGNGDGKYRLASLYYDTPDYKYYREKIDGLLFRRKLRIRWYETEKGLQDESIVFVEIKQKVDRVIQKKRVPLKYRDALLFCEQGIIPEHEDQDSAIIEEMYEMIKLNNLEPKIITTYNREAFIGGIYDLGFRLTFDHYVAYRQRNLDLGAGNYDNFIVPPQLVIMEIKTNERLPYWVTEIVSKYQLNSIRISKYCQGIDNFNSSNNFI